MENKTLSCMLKNNENYRRIVRRRSALGWLLTALVLAAYYGYILLIAFHKEVLAQKIGQTSISVGIPAGLGLIVFTVAITAFYVFVSNTKFDPELQKAIQESADELKK